MPHGCPSCRREPSWAQAGGSAALRLVRLGACQGGNVYAAAPLGFDAAGEAAPTDGPALTVTNLAEGPDPGGAAPAGAEALAADVAGRWVVFVPAAPATVFPARVVEALGQGAYAVRPQRLSAQGAFEDAPGAADVTARNLPELSRGPGAAVDAGTVVLLLAVLDADTPPTLRYVFDHGVYAKYLD